MSFRALAERLTALLDTDPADAVRQARAIELGPEGIEWFSAAWVRASILVDGGSQSAQQDAVDEGLDLFRVIHQSHPSPPVSYNLANALQARAGMPANGADWLDHQERTRAWRAEARRHFWAAANDPSGAQAIRTQAWTNLANQFTYTYRLGEAHDARLAALAVDPTNGVAAGLAALDLLWLYERGGCSELTRVEAIMLAQVALKHEDRVRAFAGAHVAKRLAALAEELGEPPPRIKNTDPFIRWAEQERLTLALAVELVDPSLDKLDWLMLPGILERERGPTAATPPPVFAMFNVMKADYILARDLAWRATQEGGWPATGRFADTLDYATYGPDASALVLAHRTALDLLDKVAVTTNYYFEVGLPPNKVYFGKIWRPDAQKKNGSSALAGPIEAAIRGGAYALYGLVELSEDYEGEEGILRLHKDLRNAGTHRFIVLHDVGDPKRARQAPEVEHQARDQYAERVLAALRVARSAIQLLALAIRQHEEGLRQRGSGRVGVLHVPDHDWVRGRTPRGPSPLRGKIRYRQHFWTLPR
jgi:hypothetical protein